MSEKAWAVWVKPSARKVACITGKVWVRDDQHSCYVSYKHRGEWPTKEEAQEHVIGPFEEVVEVERRK